MKCYLTTAALLLALGLAMAKVALEHKQRVLAALDTCTTENNLSRKDAIAMIKGRKLPETKEMKCATGCFLQRLGYVKEGRFDWKAFKATNNVKYDVPDQIEKANQVVEACGKIVTEKIDDICELGLAPLKCLYEEGVKANLPAPDYQLGA